MKIRESKLTGGQSERILVVLVVDGFSALLRPWKWRNRNYCSNVIWDRFVKSLDPSWKVIFHDMKGSPLRSKKEQVYNFLSDQIMNGSHGADIHIMIVCKSYGVRMISDMLWEYEGVEFWNMLTRVNGLGILCVDGDYPFRGETNIDFPYRFENDDYRNMRFYNVYQSKSRLHGALIRLCDKKNRDLFMAHYQQPIDSKDINHWNIVEHPDTIAAANMLFQDITHLGKAL